MSGSVMSQLPSVAQGCSLCSLQTNPQAFSEHLCQSLPSEEEFCSPDVTMGLSSFSFPGVGSLALLPPERQARSPQGLVLTSSHSLPCWCSLISRSNSNTPFLKFSLTSAQLPSPTAPLSIAKDLKSQHFPLCSALVLISRRPLLFHWRR